MDRQIRSLLSFERREAELRHDWESGDLAAGQDWKDVRDSFRLGWEEGIVHGERAWEEIEPQLAARWSDFRYGNWFELREAVREGYERGRHERSKLAA